MSEAVPESAIVETAPDVEVKKPTVFNFVPVKKPDKAEVDKQCDELQLDIDKLNEKLQNIKIEIEKHGSNRSGSRGEFEAAKQVIQKLYAEKKQLSAEKAQMIAARDSARESLNNRINQEKQLRGELKYNSLEAIDREIKELETRQARTSMSLNDEKKIIKDIKTLQQSKKTVQAIADIKATIDREKEAMSASEKFFHEKSGQLKALNDKITTQRAVLDNMNKESAEHQNVVPGLRKQEQEFLGLKNDKYQQIRNLRNEFKKAEDAYYVYLKEEKNRKREAKEKEMAARKIEEEERQKALEAEELARIPYEEDMLLCDYLVAYLQKYKITDEEGDVDTPTETNSPEIPEVGNGLKVLRRDLEDFTGGGTTKKRGKKKGGANTKKKDILVHGVDTIDFFAMLNIPPPSTTSAVSAAIEALIAKKKEFSELPRGAVPSIADRKKEANKSNTANNQSEKKSSKSSGFNLEEDFPTLHINDKAVASANVTAQTTQTATENGE